MSYRQRMAVRPPTPVETADFEIAKAYRSVFAGPLGEKVLDHICQQICGVDAIAVYADPTHAVAIVERANVGKHIARLALSTPSDLQQPKVTT